MQIKGALLIQGDGKHHYEQQIVKDGTALHEKEKLASRSDNAREIIINEALPGNQVKYNCDQDEAVPALQKKGLTRITLQVDTD